MFVVIYKPVCGYPETFGPFDTVEAATDWMYADWNHNIENAKKNGVNVDAREDANGRMVWIENYGDWNIAEVNPAKAI